MTLSSGDLKIKDPQSVRVGTFDWSKDFAAGVIFTIATVVASGPDSMLVVDNVSSAGLVVTYRVSGGTLGYEYVLTCHVETNESPVQKDDKFLRVLAQDT